MAQGCELQLCRSNYRWLGSLGDRLLHRWADLAGVGAAVRPQLAGAASQSGAGRLAAAVCARGSPAAPSAGRAQQLRAVERAGAGLDARRLRLPDRAIHHRAVAGRHRSPGAVGALMSHDADPHVLDQSWRLWASVTVVGVLLTGILLGVLIIPVVQGRSAGI